MAIYSGVTAAELNNAVILTNAVILANQNSVTITHNLGYQAKVLGVNGTDINASVFELLNQGVNSFDIAFQGGITQITDTGIAVTYV